jgi:hypothetical protein
MLSSRTSQDGRRLTAAPLRALLSPLPDFDLAELILLVAVAGVVGMN